MANRDNKYNFLLRVTASLCKQILEQIASLEGIVEGLIETPQGFLDIIGIIG